MRELVILLAPISPMHWWRAARLLASMCGWAPPMMLWALAVVVLGMNLELGRQVPWLRHFNVITFATWAIVALLAMAVMVERSAYAVMRLGPLGILRPRWWFELARVCCVIATACLTGGFFSAIALKDHPQVLQMFGVVMRPASVTIPGFLVCSTIGYLLSFVRGIPRTGRAYECVQFFFLCTGTVGVLALAAEQWPLAGAGWEAFIVPTVLLAVAIAWIVWGLISISSDFDRRQRWQGPLSHNT